jgi:cytochrome c oxidase subunit 3
MGDLINYRSPNAHEETTGFVGMVIFLGSWAMMFAALFFAYAVVRLRSPVWPPLDQPRLPVGLAAANTLLLAGSSATLQAALVLLRRGRLRPLAPAILASAGLGGLFLGLQILGWWRVFSAGMRPSSGPYASVFFGLTWFHALHVLVGLGALALLGIRAARGAYSLPRHQPVRLWTLYWHFVGVVWLAMFVTVYLV